MGASDPTEPSPEAILGEEPRAPGGAAARIYRSVGPALFEDLKAAHYRKIALQVPAGITRNAHDLAARISRETGTDVALVARACFGACDFPTPDEAPGAQANVVLGHAQIPNVPLPLPTYFVEMRESGGDPQSLARTIHAAGLPSRLGLVASVQHLD